MQYHTDLLNEVKDLQEKLAESEKDKCNILFKLEEIEDSRDLARRDMQKRVEEIKGDMNRSADLHNMEKSAMQRGYEARIQEILEDRSRQESRVRDLEQQLATLRQELETFGGAIASDLIELDTEGSDDKSSSGDKRGSRTYFKAGSDGELLDKVRELIKSESSLRQKIGELEKKVSDLCFIFLILIFFMLYL